MILAGSTERSTLVTANETLVGAEALDVGVGALSPPPLVAQADNAMANRHEQRIGEQQVPWWMRTRKRWRVNDRVMVVSPRRQIDAV
jgi:hypothetical protein